MAGYFHTWQAAVTGLVELLARAARWVRDLAIEAAGGRARARVVLTLAAVLALQGADTGTISSTTNNLEQAFHIGNTQIGLLVSVVALTGAVFTIPMGVLTDRTRRVRLLAFSIVGWAAAVLLAGAATSYWWLLAARMGLGVVTATAGPAVASLTGDFFPADERARIYGLIVGGDLVGTGIGYVISGDISSVLSWRFSFWWLIVPSLALAWVVWRLPEPARGGQSQLRPGAETIRGEDESAGQPAGSGPRAAADGRQEDTVVRQARRAHIEPHPELVLHSDPTTRSVWWAIRYVLRVRTNVVIIVASALGYFYFAGLRSFAIIFATAHYGISKPVATTLVVVIGAGALAGVYFGGRFADWLLRRGHLRARVLVPAVCLLIISVFLAPAYATTVVAIALPLLVAGAFLLGVPQPPLDAARLDIMPAQLWGRAEGVRTALRTLGEAAAPVLFGYVSQYVFGGPASSGLSGSNSSGSSSGLSPAAATGLEYTFIVFLITVVIAGLLALLALRTYPRDLATAVASAQAIADAGKPDDSGGSQAGHERSAASGHHGPPGRSVHGKPSPRSRPDGR